MTNSVTKDRLNFRDQPMSVRAVLLLVGAASLLAGLYGRFKGIGTWPLGVDEFYISRSIDNVLRTGLPQFACGGYYTRGLLYQYVVAGVREAGLSPELAGRLVAAMSSLAVLPAVYLLGRRIQGSLIGWLSVIILGVSIWEIEMARFARMYAPFQAVFAWYLVFYLRYTVDRRPTAMLYMAALSVVGVLTWEGGVLLGIANLLAVLLTHESGRLKAAQWRRLAGLLVLMALLVFATRDLRGYAELPDMDPGGVNLPPDHLRLVIEWFAPLRQNVLAACGLLIPLSLAIASLRFIASYRRQWIIACGLGFAMAAAAMHLFAITGGVLALMLLARLIDWRGLTGGNARIFLAAIACFFLFWVSFDLWAGESAQHAVLAAPPSGSPPVVQYLFGYPDIYGEVIRPWGRTFPILSAAIGLSLAYWFCQSVVIRRSGLEPVAAVLSLIVLLVLAVGATATDRIETRYTYFLYPLFIILAVAALLSLAQRLELRPTAWAAAAMLPLVCFCLTEDFQPRHLAAIDSARINFRVGMTPVRAAHYYPRNDVRSVGLWLESQIQPGDTVITGIANLDPYYHRIDYFYLGFGDPRYESYVCGDGVTERWSNRPVLYTERALESLVSPSRRVYAILYPKEADSLTAAARLKGWSVRRVWTSATDRSDVVLIISGSVAPANQ